MAQKKKSTQKKNSDNLIISIVIALVIFVFTLSCVVFKASMGIVGRLVSQGMFIVFGLSAYLVPFILLFLFFAIRNKVFWKDAKNKILVLMFLLMTANVFLATFWIGGGSYGQMTGNSYNQAMNYSGVGFLFTSIYFIFNKLIANIGIYIFTVFVFFLSYFYLFDKSITAFFRGIFKALAGALSNSVKDIKEKKRERVKKTDFKLSESSKIELESKDQELREIYREEIIHKDPVINFHTAGEDSSFAQSQNTLELPKEEEDFSPENYDQMGMDDIDEAYDDYNYIKPPVELLSIPQKSKSDSRDILIENARKIEETLRSFGIESEVVNINNGPTVTSYEVKPQSGIKVSKIVNLSNDLSLALASSGVRIEAPIPGKPYVGIEVPNQNKDIVAFRELIFNDEFQKENNDITVALGKNLFGKPIYANINEMPHLLVAGATGSGKSVMINAIIMSIIYKYSPKDVQFIMIDPKMVELNIYNGIPHLSKRKVVTDAARATNALKYAVDEMIDRFEKFSKIGCRDIGGYNQIAFERGMNKMPYFVVIIDELSDLMMEASKDVENYITRLAQMGRASGIHLIVATQRPSVDVITGVIKANIPSRISFQVSSQVDSRTILDAAGAEKLLGKGDMLYFPGKFPKPMRVQGAFLSDKEVENVVNFIKNQNVVQSDESFNDAITQTQSKSSVLEDQDELLNEAIEFVIRENQASISAVQRRFRVGYARAGRMIDQMEKLGIIGEHDGSKPRKILKDLSYLDQQNSEESENVEEV